MMPLYNNNKYIKICVLIVFVINIVFAKQFSPYYTETQHIEYLRYLITSGKIDVKYPLSQPFTVDELLLQIKEYDNKNNVWIQYLYDDLKRLSASEDICNNNGKIIISGNGGVGYEAKNGGQDYFYNIQPSVMYLWNTVGMRYQYSIDRRYLLDTTYFGATGKFGSLVSGRADEAYMGFQTKDLKLFFGRINRNFGIMGEPGLLISDNPYSYDHIAFNFQNDFLKFTHMFARLNDIYGYDIRQSEPEYEWETRFLSVHRFEINLNSKLHLAFTESMLFGGSDHYPQFQYLNPSNIFFFSKMAERKGYQEKNANAMIAFELYYKPINKITLFGQFLLDDMDFTKELREQYPDRIGFSIKIIYSDPFPGSQISLTYNRISNWTYNSFYTFGNHTYYSKSLGYPLHGAENIRIDFDIYSIKYFIFNLSFKAEQKRRQDLNTHFIAEKTLFPIGTPEKYCSMGLALNWFPKSYLYAKFNTECVVYKNNINSTDDKIFELIMNIQISYILNTKYK